MKKQINEQLALLERELSRLKKVTDYVDNTKKTAQVIISELKEVQNNYSIYTEKIFDLYKISIEQLKRKTELQIKEGVTHFETTGSQIDQTNREKLVETKKLLENYRKTVEATDNLVKTLESVNFPTRLDTIEQKIDNNLKKNLQKFDLQDKQNKIIKILLFIILGLIGIGGISAILIWMKII